MSSKSKFIVGIILMLLAVVVIEYRMPRRFQWTPTFGHKDAQPFGCMLLDSMMAQTMPCGYTVVDETLWQMQRDSMLNEPCGIVILTTDDLKEDLLKSHILPLVEQGHVVLLGVTRVFGWEDTLGLRFDWNNSFDIRNIAGKHPEKYPVNWVDTTDGYPVDSSLCRVYDVMVHRVIRTVDRAKRDEEKWVFDEDTGVWLQPDMDEEATETEAEEADTDEIVYKTLAIYDDNAIALSIQRGKGELILLSAPLLMTNYAMVNHDDGAVFVHRLMNRMKHLPVIRTEAYMGVTAREEQSPFYVLLERPPFRWALYLTFMGIVLYCIFTARRRQRPIPVISQPQNGNLEFVRLIGMLYWQEGNHQELLKKKLTYTAEEIHRQTGLDILDSDNEMETMAQLARLTGEDPDNLRIVIRNVKEAVASYRAVTVAEMKALVAELDRIVSNI